MGARAASETCASFKKSEVLALTAPLQLAHTWCVVGFALTLQALRAISRQMPSERAARKKKTRHPGTTGHTRARLNLGDYLVPLGRGELRETRQRLHALNDINSNRENVREIREKKREKKKKKQSKVKRGARAL